MKPFWTAAAGLALALAVGAGVVQAQDRVSPGWRKPPDPHLGMDLYPRFASIMNQQGWATVKCRIEADGHPFNCEVIDEWPYGLGFGSAARVVVASGEIAAAREGGQIVGRPIQTTVRFSLPQGPIFGGWKGPEPSAEALALARQLAEQHVDVSPPLNRDVMLGGLDYDRRQIVLGWFDELMPIDVEREKEGLALTIARLATLDQIRGMIAGVPMEEPSDEDYYAAGPDPTPEDLAVYDEIKRRFCERWDCRAREPQR